MDKKYRIMVVDNDLDMDAMWELADKGPDMILGIKHGALMALQHLHDLNYKCDAVVLDLMMPDKNGMALTEEIRQNEALRSKQYPIAIFWYTGFPIDQNDPADPATEAMIEFNVCKVFTKPMSPDAIIAEVRGVLESRDSCGDG